MSCTKKPRPSANLHQWIFASGLQTPLNFSRISQNVTEPIQKPWKSKKPLGIWAQIPLLSREALQSASLVSAEFMTHRVSFLQPLQNMQSCSFRNCGTKKKIRTSHWVNHINKHGARYVRAWLHYPLSHYPDILRGDKHKLFCFTDACANAYSAAVYLYSSVNGKVTVNLTFSKAHVAPAKPLSIPRLELLHVGVLIRTRCLNYKTQQLQLSVVDRFLWTDSQCVLCWMKLVSHYQCLFRTGLENCKSTLM